VCLLGKGETVNIGLWLRNQKTRKKGIAGKTLSHDREQRLQQLVDQGKLQWDIQNFRDWDFMYSLMIQYGHRFGTCNVPQNYKEILPEGGRVSLGNWVHTQRQRRNSLMSEDHRQKLQALVDEGLFKWRMVSDERLNVAVYLC